MAGRHGRSSSKAPTIIAIVMVSLVVLLAIFIVIKQFSNTLDGNAGNETTVQTTVSETTETQPETEPQTTEQGVTIPDSTDVDKVVVPTQSGVDAKYFNATYVPYKAEDTYGMNDDSDLDYEFDQTSEDNSTEVSLKEVFGSAYSGGVITFNEDGTFTDTLLYSSLNKGSYAVNGDHIVATYVNDKNMDITVNGWDGDTPSELIINYGGYDVFFSL